MKDEWLTDTDPDYWSDWQRTQAFKYCQQYARVSDPKTILPEFVQDLRNRGGMVRTMIYCLVVISWQPEETKPLLERYSKSKDANEKRAADDLLAEVEQL